MKSLRIVNNVGSLRDVAVGIGDAFYGYNRVFRAGVAANSTYVDPDTDPIVLHEGQSLTARIISAGAAVGDVTVTISGAELTA